MKHFVTSSPMNHVGTAINDKNSFLQKLKEIFPNDINALYICADPTDYESTDKYSAVLKQCFINSGFSFGRYNNLDYRNKDRAKELITAADLLIMSGGHVPTQNAFITEINLKELIKDYKGCVLGFSAGAMNMADIVYAMPEAEGEAVSKEYKRFLSGLGLTKSMIIPHYYLIKDDILDGMRLFEDIAYPDSTGRQFYVLPDPSYIEICGDEETIYGEAYMIKDGIFTQISYPGKRYKIKPL